MTLALWILACQPEPVEHVSRPHPPRMQDEPLVRRGLRFPAADPSAFSTRVGIDHDPVVQPEDLVGRTTCTDYLGRTFPFCYDEHHGTDFILDGGFPAMDAGSAEVVAAADGIVLEVDDSNYDRCHVDGTGVSCDGHPIVNNKIVIEHEDGRLTKYWHIMQHSALVKEGDVVLCGDPLARVGSAGNSSMPHLHFQVEQGERWVDPYAGPFSQPESLWALQGNDALWPATSCEQSEE
jgi:murein DD-endopeptidase MepM/ murein hydrolase activator NlpD